MKTIDAMIIAQEIWNDTIVDGSLFDSMMKLAPVMEQLIKEGKHEELQAQVIGMREEVVARWANIIIENSSK